MGLAVAALVAFLNLWLTPHVQHSQKQLRAKAEAAPLVKTMIPGRFYSLHHGQRVAYVHDVAANHTQLKHLFLAQQDPQHPRQWQIIIAKDGYQPPNQQHQLVVRHGYRYQVAPGEKNAQTQHFRRLIWFMGPKKVSLDHRAEFIPTSQLWRQANAQHPRMAAEWQWRLSMPLSVLILTVLAVPLSQANPRQGKLAHLLPAILIYIIYANMMFVCRNWIEQGQLPLWLGLWWLHGLLILVACCAWLSRSYRVMQWMKPIKTRWVGRP
jgi:lipopolysaccharide export system permease protein